MFRVHQVKYFTLILALLFVLTQIQSIARANAHAIDGNDCRICQLFAQNASLDLPEYSFLYASELNVFYSFFLLVLFSIPIVFLIISTRAPPATLHN